MNMSVLKEYMLHFDIESYNSYKEILDHMLESRIVMLGEASHGTYEFYAIRQKLSQYLIQEKGFNAIAIEGDFTNCYNVNLYLQGEGDRDDPLNALRDFKRFPTWMWRNEMIVPFLRELREYNDESKQKVHFFGLDLYSLHGAIQAVINYLKMHDIEAARDAIKRYSCFENTTHDPQEYGALVRYSNKKACTQEVAKQVIALQEMTFKNHYNLDETDQLFYATQNARLVQNAENYYRGLFEPHVNTWNIRDTHMFETLQNILAYLSKTLKVPAKIIIWAHNSHLGNAKATEMSSRGDTNIGELIKDHYRDCSFSLGFSTYSGTVLAADEWGESPQVKFLNKALPGSYEELFHNLSSNNFAFIMKNNPKLQKLLSSPRLQRAVGVIYKPETERWSHYYNAELAHQFDAILHIDTSRAIKEI